MISIKRLMLTVHHSLHDAINQPTYYTNLGNGLLMRYQQTGQLSDLESAIMAFRNAFAVAPMNSSNRHGYLNNMASGPNARYVHTKEPADLDDSIRYFEQAIRLLPTDSTDLSIYLGNLGLGFRHRYDHTGQLTDLADGYESFRRACDIGQSVALKEVLRGARNCGNWALERHEWMEATQAYAYGRRAIGLLFAPQTSRAAKDSWLKEAQGLPANAAYALARRDRLVDVVETIEAGRARLLAEALEQNHRDLEQLEPLGHKAVLDRYRASSQRVAALQQQASQPATQSLRDSSQSPNQPVTQSDYTAWRQQLDQASAELHAAIDAIRVVPGTPVSQAEALRSAQIWLRDSSNRAKAEYFKRDVPTLAGVRMPELVAAELYVERMLQRDGDARQFEHPFHWAAFTMTGA